MYIGLIPPSRKSLVKNLFLDLCNMTKRSSYKLGPMRWEASTYMQKTCDVAEEAILAKKNLRKNCVNHDKM